jgi:hypothetical protein
MYRYCPHIVSDTLIIYLYVRERVGGRERERGGGREGGGQRDGEGYI